MATQEERRAETRTALLDAGATLFAERGIAGASVDAIAAAAGRTSGALYDHFGSKEGLLFALLETWVGDATVAIAAEQAAAASLDEWVAAMWHAVARPPSGDGRWIALEHELWSYAAQSDEARRYLAKRYQAAWAGIADHARTWVADPPASVGATVIGLLLGLEMMRRVDPAAVTDEVAVTALKAVLGTDVGARAPGIVPSTPT
ncbi:TetR/AcrR family transcriptional regulator [Iamia sp. SCSIO 61187]|uniref:TetR/AcrR family transcriptional regulator n=1 Tax=Iamia sp. SCSIO 61187 TaxID=2722752 RepID=UPI001C62601E|nr:TetR/AcrR family transcriptional regulator [Iamia sp. SCSIO 61187]QYG92149.1 TetR/AcrR family transcriptional regulator [Iamia sp. SCSIO 61187]